MLRMDHRLAEHFAEAMTRLTKHPHRFAPAGDQPHTEQPEAPRGSAFAIAFSREAGSGGISVAREVGRRLSWPVYDQELLESLAKELNVDISYLEDYDQGRRGSFLVDTIKAFSAAASVSEATYFRGECLIVGRGSSFVLPPETTLRVRIVASRDDRIAFIARDRKLSPVEAAHFVDTRDRVRQEFIKDYFHKDRADPQNYDLILNRSRFSLDETADLVIQALQRIQARKTGDIQAVRIR